MSEYILDLRKIVGHRPLIQVGASVIVEDSRGYILLQKRTDNGCWGQCGGSMELFESAEATARRELFEESGLVAGELELFGIYSGEDMRYTYPNGDVVSVVDIVYLCREYSGSLRPQLSEVSELRFFAPDALPENLSEPNESAITDWCRKKKQAD